MTVALADNELLRDFEPDWVDWFEERCIAVGFSPGDHMIEGGHAAAGLYLLLGGKVVVLSNRGDRLARICAGSVIGEMALVDGGLRSADVMAETDVATLLMTKHQFQTIGRSRPDIALVVMTNLCRIISTRLRHLHQLFG
jgi:glutaminase